MPRLPRVIATIFASLLVSSGVCQGQAARALAPRSIPLPERVALASCIVMGKVTLIEEKLTAARPSPNIREKINYKVAVVKIDETLLGAKGLTHLRIGFVSHPAPPENGPRILPHFRPPFPPVNLEKGQEFCFFLMPHFEEAFYLIPPTLGSLSKRDPGFEKQLAQIKHQTQFLQNPRAGLTSKDASVRFQTAALLVVRYRHYQGSPHQEPIDAEESKLILQALAEGDWSKGYSQVELTPLMAFTRLGLGPKDGWKPGPFKSFPKAAQTWLQEHAGTYRIQRFTAMPRIPATRK